MNLTPALRALYSTEREMTKPPLMQLGAPTASARAPGPPQVLGLKSDCLSSSMLPASAEVIVPASMSVLLPSFMIERAARALVMPPPWWVPLMRAQRTWLSIRNWRVAAALSAHPRWSARSL
jgi:hypothetical protein